VTFIAGVNGDESSTDSFRWEGDEDSLEIKSNINVAHYSPSRAFPSFPSCCQALDVSHDLLGSPPTPLCSLSGLTLAGDDIIPPPGINQGFVSGSLS
jgi:hypothetical protein